MENISKLIIYLLAVYGAMSLLFCLFSLIKGRTNITCGKLGLILIVKNVEENIEFVVYNIYKRILSDRSIPVNALTIMDMGSNDKTQEILTRLRNDYGVIELQNDSKVIFKDFT